MAAKLFRWIAALTIALTWVLSVPAVHAAAAPGADPAPLGLYHITFYLDPALLTDPQFARAVLPKYVSDMNSVLAKNTRRQLAFDPETGIIPAASKPQSDWAPSPLATDGFDIWAYAVPSDSLVYGPYVSVDQSGAAVLAGLNWTKIHDPDALSDTSEVQDYTAQINSMLHELAHVFGAGIGEYYSLWRVLDSTQAEPLMGISAADPADAYWSDKRDFMADPLLQFNRSDTRAGYLARAQYSELTAAVMNGAYRNGVPVLTQFTVQVVDRDGQPVPSAQVKVWNVQARSPYTSQLLYDVQADEQGRATLAWGGVGSPRSSANMLRLIKVYRDGAPLTLPRYISVFDGEIAQLVRQESALVVTMQQANHAPTALEISNASIEENQPAGTLIGTLSALDYDPGDALTYSLCGGPDDAAFTLMNAGLVSAMPFDREAKSSYTVCAAVSDGNGGTLERSIVISVEDVPENVQAEFKSQATADGWVLESSGDSGRGGSVNAAGRGSWLGFDSAGREYRSVLSFDTSSLPDEAVITSAALRVRQKSGTGGELTLLIDLRKNYLGTSAMLQANDYQARATAAADSGSEPVYGWYTTQLEAGVLGLVNRTGTTQLRLRLDPALSDGSTLISFFTGNAIAANRPRLVVEYYIP